MRYTLFTTPILSPILHGISRIILTIIRWRVVGVLPTDHRKYVLIVAPHTSNWDFVLFVLATFELVWFETSHLLYVHWGSLRYKW